MTQGCGVTPTRGDGRGPGVGQPPAIPRPGRSRQQAGCSPDSGVLGQGDAVWTDGSRQNSGRVGVACAWRTPSGWAGRLFHLGSNKEVLGAEVYAIYQAFSIMDKRQESGRSYTLFVDSIQDSM